MKKEIGDSKLFLSGMFVVIGVLLISISLTSLLNILWLFVGLCILIIGVALKSAKK